MLEAPSELLDTYAVWKREPVSVYPGRSAMHRLSGPDGETHYLKVVRRGWTPSAEAEAERTDWAARDFHPEFAALTVEAAVEEFAASVPEAEDLVVCHGDYCVPNVLLRGTDVVGFVDLGELGVADRWWDLAVATWSVTWNFGPGYENQFLESYGALRDEKRIRFYRLLYDLVS